MKAVFSSTYCFVFQLEIKPGQLEVVFVGPPDLLPPLLELVEDVLEGQDHVDLAEAIAEEKTALDLGSLKGGILIIGRGNRLVRRKGFEYSCL